MAAKLGHYEVNINGIRHEFKLNAEDAERMGATEVKKTTKEAKAPANKAVAPANK
jgi:hypothetical protein